MHACLLVQPSSHPAIQRLVTVVLGGDAATVVLGGDAATVVLGGDAATVRVQQRQPCGCQPLHVISVQGWQAAAQLACSTRAPSGPPPQP
jgi:hypothetical protein